MKLIKLNTDTSQVDNPEGTYRNAKNITSVRNKNYKINENGVQIFERKGVVDDRNLHKYNQLQTFNSVQYYRHEIGKIECDLDRVIIFSILYYGSDTYSEIGLIEKDGYYTTVINDLDGAVFTTNNKLGFTANHPIIGEFGYFKNDLICAFTDNNVAPKVVNISELLRNPPTSAKPFQINDILMFPEASQYTVTSVINNSGGQLTSGSHYIVAKYENIDGSSSNYLTIDNPLYIFKSTFNRFSPNSAEGDATPVTTSKSVKLTFSNLDTRYDFLTIAVIKKQNNETICQQIAKVPIVESSLIYTYTGGEQAVDISLAEITVKREFFRKVKILTQLQNRLYCADSLGRPKLKYQKYANMIGVNIVSKAIQPLYGDSAKDINYNHNNKSFQHREVVALYLHWEYLDGTLSEGFTIPSRVDLDPANVGNLAVLNGFRQSSTLAALQGITAKKFQIEDTTAIVTKNPSGQSTITPGFWENQDEVYPTTTDNDFDSTVDYDGNPLGGINFVGQKVRHHRMPSIQWMKENIYDGEARYGKDILDVLGIELTNVVCPAHIAPHVRRWVVSFAKRDYSNSTVIGQSHPIFSSNGHVFDGSAYTSNALNIQTKYSDSELVSQLIKNRMRLYDFSLMRNNPAVTPAYIANELFYVAHPTYRGSSDEHLNETSNRHTLTLEFTGADEAYVPTSPYGSGVDCRLRKVNLFRYTPNNVIVDNDDNRKLENSCVVELNADVVVNPEGITKRFDYTTGHGSEGWDTWSGSNNVVSYLTTLMSLPANVYESFYTQNLVLTGQFVTKGTTSGTFYHGDIYIVINSINALGIGVDLAQVAGLGEYSGIRVAYSWICESTLNSELRNSTSSNPRTKYLPKYPVVFRTNDVANRLEEISNINAELPYDYSVDYSTLNDLNTIAPYNPYLTYTETRPFRINRCQALNKESNVNNWKYWLINDYAEGLRDRGELVNLQGFDRNLFIHYASALYITVGNEQINVDNVTAFIGTGDIFEREPLEIEPDKRGSCGTQDRFSCLLTKHGYVFIDSDKFMLNICDGKSVSVLSDNLMRQFFRDNIRYSKEGYPVRDNPYYYNGYSIAYDYANDRIIITKRDLELLQPLSAEFYIVDGLFYEFTGDAPVLVDYDNPLYFKNKSFTLSYSFSDNGFTSFHDYLPNVIFNTRTNVLAFVNTIEDSKTISRIYKHNYEGNKAIYYNTSIKDIDSTSPESATPYPSLIVPCFALGQQYKDVPSFKFINVFWIANMFNANGAYIPDKTFSKLLAFNTYQSTPELDLIVFDFNQYFESNTRNIKGTWHFNKLRNFLRTDIFTNPSPPEPFIVDYELNASNNPIDLTKEFSLCNPLSDKFLTIKLLYNNEIISNLQNEIQIVSVGCKAEIVTR